MATTSQLCAAYDEGRRACETGYGCSTDDCPYAATTQPLLWTMWQRGYGAEYYGRETTATAELIPNWHTVCDILTSAIARVQLANDEGNPILSAWLGDAKFLLAQAQAQVEKEEQHGPVVRAISAQDV